ncbi:hypothetical protein [Thauera phenolivorans]|uniref:hypothetical protein n=1 Tax=Thauera phenolivorans TaxID=1792543 RepID=UPI00083B8732|nr:hypothetical protein [Thauera phenolivorans]
MIYVRRNPAGEVVAASRQAPAEGDPGWLPADPADPALAAFGSELAARANPLSASDLGFVRVLEDVIDLLVARGVILFTDLPPAAQDKLMERRSTRAGLGGRLSLLDDTDGVI